MNRPAPLTTPDGSFVYTAEFRTGCTCSLTIGSCGARIEWSRLPTEFPATKRGELLASYRLWRDACLEDFARRTGHRVAVVDL